MVDYNPHITGDYNPLNTLNNLFFFIAQLLMLQKSGENTTFWMYKNLCK